MTDAIKLADGLLRQAAESWGDGDKEPCDCTTCVVARSAVAQKLATEVLTAHKRIGGLEAGLARAVEIAEQVDWIATIGGWKIVDEREAEIAALKALASKPTEGEGQ